VAAALAIVYTITSMGLEGHCNLLLYSALQVELVVVATMHSALHMYRMVSNSFGVVQRWPHPQFGHPAVWPSLFHQVHHLMTVNFAQNHV
jgi:hypothetical protein